MHYNIIYEKVMTSIVTFLYELVCTNVINEYILIYYVVLI